MKSLLLVVLVVGFGGLCHGRLFETKAECDARYGQPLIQLPDTGDQIAASWLYQYGGINVVCGFDANGVCQSIYYSKPTKLPLTTREQAVFLEANKGSAKSWAVLDVSTQKTTMVRSDGLAVSSYNQERAGLILTSKTVLDESLGTTNSAGELVNPFGGF